MRKITPSVMMARGVHHNQIEHVTIQLMPGVTVQEAPHLGADHPKMGRFLDSYNRSTLT